LIVIGAALGIGRIGGSAMDAIARQPEASGKNSNSYAYRSCISEELVSLYLLLNKS
jgi:F0F1-type ATP synthase membrane subunit c/vacuolar-type H+-ATPase subunit K